MSRKRKLARADEVLQTLGLMDCADNMVGGELLKGISGGEKRRLSLAVEMINGELSLQVHVMVCNLDAYALRSRCPHCWYDTSSWITVRSRLTFFLSDEPTSGLDAMTAHVCWLSRDRGSVHQA